MANLKDLIVNGAARIIGKVYSSGGFVGNLTGDVTGNLTGTATNATKLETARSLNIANSDGTNASTGVNFNGTSNVTLKLPTTIKAAFSGNLTGNADSATKATNDSDGNPINTTYLKRSGGSITGPLLVNANANAIGNFDEGIRINQGKNGFATFVIGGPADSTSQTKDGQWWIGCNPGSYGRKLYIAHNGSITSNTYFYASSESQVSPAFYCEGGFVGNLTGTATKATQDGNGNTITTTYGNRGAANTWSAVNTFTNNATPGSGSTSPVGAIIASEGGIWAKQGIYGNKVYNAVWNDLADCIEVDKDCTPIPGYCYCFDGERYYKSTKYMDDGIIGLHSDTYGIHMGSKPGCNLLDVAVAGFVLAYVDKEYPVGTPLTCTEDGKLTEIKKSDKIEYPEKIIATFWKPEKNKTWGSEGSEIQVNGRMWVKVK